MKFWSPCCTVDTILLNSNAKLRLSIAKWWKGSNKIAQTLSSTQVSSSFPHRLYFLSFGKYSESQPWNLKITHPSTNCIFYRSTPFSRGAVTAIILKWQIKVISVFVPTFTRGKAKSSSLMACPCLMINLLSWGENIIIFSIKFWI